MADQFTDFNDLHVNFGLAEVKRQIDLAIDRFKSSRSPSDDSPALQAVLNRYALVHGETKYYDCQEQKIIKKQAFVELITKPVFDEWSKHPERRVVDRNSLSYGGDHGGDDGRAHIILGRYVYIYPTKDVWDTKRREMLPLEVLKCAWPDYYDWWLKHPGRRSVVRENLVFDPSQRCDPETHINMFHGLPLTPSGDTGECSAILNILWNLCNSDQEIFHWVVCWLAYPLQHVGAKLDTALIFHSDVHGTGKSLFFADIVAKLYGQYATVVGQHQLESQYSDWRSNMLYGVFEEIFSRSGKYDHVGTTKHLITGKTQRIEKKFVSGWEESNHMNCVFLSNEIQPFPIERSDRRMCVVWPRQTLEKEEFTMASDQAENGGIEALYNYLLNYDLDDFNPHTKPPMNDDKQRLISFGLPSWEVFFDEWSGGFLEVPFLSCKSTSLFAVYKRFCNEWNEKPVSMQRFVGFVGAKLKVARKRYNLGINSSHPKTFVLVPPSLEDPRPEGETEQDYLGYCQKCFEDAMQQGDSDQ